MTDSEYAYAVLYWLAAGQEVEPVGDALHLVDPDGTGPGQEPVPRHVVDELESSGLVAVDERGMAVTASGLYWLDRAGRRGHGRAVWEAKRQAFKGRVIRG